MTKIKYNLVSVPDGLNIKIPDFLEEIPCNVCSKHIALQNVFRKHGESGSWQPLERDIFLHKFMGESKSVFLILEEETGIVSANPHLNQGFVKGEIFKKDILENIGFSIKNGHLYSKHEKEDESAILSDISNKVKKKDLTTRKNRGKVYEVLEPSCQELIDQNQNNEPHPSRTKFKNSNKSPCIGENSSRSEDSKKVRKQRSRRVSTGQLKLFGGRLYLHSGEVSNLYRDIVDLYDFYITKKSTLSQTFPNLIRMSLRLLCETAGHWSVSRI